MKFVDDILIFIEHENLAFIGKEGIGIDLAGFFIHEDHIAERSPLSRPHSYNGFLRILRVADHTDDADGNAQVERLAQRSSCASWTAEMP